MTEEEVIFWRRLHSDFEFYSTRCLQIRNKEQKKVQFKFNKAQRYLHAKAEAQRKRTGKVRVIVLKGRQQGISTYIGGRGYWKSSLNEGIRVFILTHEAKATENLYQMAVRYHQNCPPRIRPSMGEYRKELQFPAIESGYAVGTAGAAETGRSATFAFFHGSEVAFWENDQTHAAASLQAVPDTPGTEIWMESTANGAGNWFHRQIVNSVHAIRRGEEPEWEFVFIPWFWQPEYRAPAPPSLCLTTERDPLSKTFGDESLLVRKYGLDIEQIAWRRKKILTLDGPACSGLDKFKQEYPCDWMEAFRFAGNKFFSPALLERIAGETMDPKYRGVLHQTGSEIRFVHDPFGYLEVWEPPDPLADYVMGGDVSEGLPHGDLNSGHVIRRGSQAEQVARVSPVCGADETGRIYVLTCLYYGGRVPLGIERNNTAGGAAVTAAVDTGYEHVYHWQQERGNLIRSQLTPGWKTTSASRPDLLNDLLATCRDASLIIRSEETLSQMETFIRNDKGRPAAAPDTWDDDVIGLGIAWQMYQKCEKIPRPEAASGRYAAASGAGAWMG